MIVLHDFQSDAVAEVKAAVANGKRRILIVAPTGAGKTIVASDLVGGAIAEGKRALMVAHRRELVGHAYRKLADAGLWAGTILADDHRADGFAAIQVGSIQTIHARAIRGTKLDLPRADLLIIDEAHRIRARTYRQLLDAYPNAVLMGLTATPCRGDGRGLGNVFDTMIQCPDVQQLIDLGHLVGTVVYAPSTPDLKGVTVRHGDYVEGQLADRMDRPQLVGDIVTHWHRLAQGRKTVIFASSVAHSRHIADEFIRAGVAAAHLDGSTPTAEREAILARLSRGDLTVVSNYMVLTEGWDQPDVSCCVLARPTKHMGLYRQMVGRVLRPFPGKSHALVLDHAGAIFQHGRVEDHVEWALDEDKRAESRAHRLRQQAGSRSRLVTCYKCSAIRMAGEPCPQCGWYPKARAESADFIDDDLVRVDRSGRVHPRDWSQPAKDRFFGELLWYAAEHGYKRGWAFHKFKERIGRWPLHKNPPLAEPSPETLSWIRSRNIAWAKSKGRAA